LITLSAITISALKVDFDACHPEDIIDHIIDHAYYSGHSPKMIKENIDTPGKIILLSNF